MQIQRGKRFGRELELSVSKNLGWLVEGIRAAMGIYIRFEEDLSKPKWLCTLNINIFQRSSEEGYLASHVL